MKDPEISIYDICYSRDPFRVLKKWAARQQKTGYVKMEFGIEYDEYGGISEIKLKALCKKKK